MSQITRCPSCGTAFKVVADQLRISDGWVRCGQCKEVFDASVNLQGAVSAPPLLPDLSLPAAGRAPLAESPPLSDSIAAQQRAHAAPAVPEPVSAAAEAPASPPAPPVPSFLAASLRSAGVPQAPDWMLEPAAPFGWRTREKVPPGGPAAPPAAAEAEPEDGSTPVPADVEAESGSAVPDTSDVPDAVPDLAGYELPFAELRDSDWPDDMAGDDSDALSETEVPLPAIERDARDEAAATRGPGAEASEDGAEPADEAALPARIAWPEDDGGVPPIRVADTPDSHGPPTAPAELLAEAFEPDFVRAARRKAFWRRPVVRVVTGAIGLVLLSALALQVLWYERDRVAAWQPGWRPLLVQWCASLNCTLAPPRQIADVVIESSAFNKARGESYQLLLTLKSRAGIALAMPSVELTLTDAQDQPLLRRVLSPSELGAPAALAAHGEWNAAVPVVVTANATRVAGYRVLAFYP